MNYTEFLHNKRISHKPNGFQGLHLDQYGLFEWQQKIVEQACRTGRYAIFAGTGLGKTAMQLCWAYQVVQHTNKPVLILTPLAVAKQTVREGAKFGIEVTHCRDRLDVQKGVNVTNYEMLHHFDTSKFSGVVLDECFAQGTMIDTINGEVAIEKIQVGDSIINASGVDEVSDVHKREVQYAVRITTTRASFIASPNHPIFTQRGWVGAQHLRPGDYALETREAVSVVRGDVLAKIPSSETSEVLRDILLSEMADDSAGDNSESSFSRSGIEERNEEVSVVCSGQRQGYQGTGTHQIVKSNEQCRVQTEVKPRIESHEARTFRAWWQWQGDDDTAVDSDGCVGRRMGSGIGIVTGTTKSRLSHALQTRLRESESQVRNRGGWKLASLTQESRCEEGRYAGFVRVEGIKILESGHPELERFRDANGKLYFYDLGGTRHPSYSVGGILVHNSSILKSFMGKTRIAITRAFESTPYRLACTATPSPNDQLEIGNHCHFLSVMTGSEMIMRFFVNDTMKAGGYRLKGHAEGEFWRWMSTWAVGLTSPHDLGYDDDQFILPELNVTEHRVDSEKARVDGQLFPIDAPSATELHGYRKLTTADRAALVAEKTPDDYSIIWVNTDYEADAIRDALPSAVEIHGRMRPEQKEELLDGFSLGQFKHLLTKPSICGFGMNWQHCNDMSFAGMSYSFEDLFQAIRRCYRFGQKRKVNVRLFLTDSDDHVASAVQRKAHMHEAMVSKLSAANRETWGEQLCQQLQLRKYDPSKSLKLPSWLHQSA